LVVDADYRGNVGVVLFNHADEDFEVKRGDRVAQLILERISYAAIAVVDEIDETARGAGGFGSTGVELPLKRARPDEADASSSDDTVIFTALEKLFASGAIDDATRVQLKTRAFAAAPHQLALLRSALSEYLATGDEGKAVEWATAFAAATTN
jgi:hypothetical protein